jgi:hypothetical protein
MRDRTTSPAVRSARPEFALLGWADRVRVVHPRAPHTGQAGTVRKVWNDAGEIVARVALDNGETDTYDIDELDHLADGPDPK